MKKGTSQSRRVFVLGIGMSFFLGMSLSVHAEKSDSAKPPRILYPKKTELDFEGLRIQGEVRNPGEFYYQRKSDEKLDSLVKRRPHFRREMLRDAVMSR
jgi:hypothetical protein